MLVWFMDWQVAEDHVLVTQGDFVDWTLHLADTDWVARLFGNRLAVDWAFDTYGAAVDQPSRQVQGRVADVRGVRCRQTRTAEGIVPVPGAARLQSVHDTSSSWIRPVSTQPRTTEGVDDRGFAWRSYSSMFGEGDAEYLYGYVVTVADEPGATALPSSP